MRIDSGLEITKTIWVQHSDLHFDEDRYLVSSIPVVVDNLSINDMICDGAGRLSWC